MGRSGAVEKTPRTARRAAASATAFLLAIGVLVGALCLGNPWRGGPPADVAPFPAQPAATRVDSEPPRGAVVHGPGMGPGHHGAAPEEDVGACPERYADLPVLRAGRDQDGWPTWWHADGTITKRAVQRVRAVDGTILEMPVVLHFKARGAR